MCLSTGRLPILLKTFIFYADLELSIVNDLNNFVMDQPFKVYWNSPTFQCKSHGILFNDLKEQYGIIHNEDGSFRGDQIALLYDPGNFPALLDNPKTGELQPRNGGVPQEGDLEEHLTVFKEKLAELIPDESFNGLAVIDFESWRPIFRQHWSKLKPYQDRSIEIEMEKHPTWSEKEIKNEAVRRFEEAGRIFMESTIKLAKTERPMAKWGYYAYPYCFNMGKDRRADCSEDVMEENDRLQWLWDESDVLFPSFYLNNETWNEEDRLHMTKGRMNEAMRISSRTKHNPPVIAYMWYKYRNDEFVTKEDWFNCLNQVKKSGGIGAIIWGSSNDVNTKEKGLELKEYLETTLGPVVAEFTNEETCEGDL